MPDWTPQEKALAAAALYGVYRDIESTKDFLDRGGKETNPLLGEHPSDGKVNAAGVLAGLGGLLAINALPEKYRAALLGGWAGFEHTLADQNKKVQSGQPEREFLDVIKNPAIASILSGLLAHNLFGRKYDNTMITLSPNSLTLTKKF